MLTALIVRNNVTMVRKLAGARQIQGLKNPLLWVESSNHFCLLSQAASHPCCQLSHPRLCCLGRRWGQWRNKKQKAQNLTPARFCTVNVTSVQLSSVMHCTQRWNFCVNQIWRKLTCPVATQSLQRIGGLHVWRPHNLGILLLPLSITYEKRLAKKFANFANQDPGRAMKSS